MILHFREPKNDENEIERRELLENLNKTKKDLEQARASFNYVVAPELIEACVYEINSLQARYNYLLKLLREKELDASKILK